jgi:tetraacyldisaccharide 4'-kinase
LRIRLIFLLYRLLLAAISPFIVLYLLRRTFRDRRYLRNLAERFGILPRTVQGTSGVAIWLHAVSVGEVLSSIRLLERVRAVYPAAGVFVTSSTLAGRAIAAEKLQGLATGVFYAPIDYCFAVRRVLRALRPSLVIVLETEIWPNLYREVKRSRAGLLIANGRISDRAMPRYSSLRWFFRDVLSLPDAILVQNRVAAGRFLELGAPKAKVREAGNLKYDFDPGRWLAPEVVVSLIECAAPTPVWIAASTMPPAHTADVDEDEVVLDAFERLVQRRSQLLLILAPRRPERFDVVAQKLKARRIPFLRRSELRGDAHLPLPCVLLLDSIGELSGLFRLANVVFMGGTLAERGGHNVLEPAFFGCPVIAGPHMENFPDIAAEFTAGGGLIRISKPSELEQAVDSLLQDHALRARAGDRARELALAKRGAADRVLQEVETLLRVSVPQPAHRLPARAVLWPLTLLWRIGLVIKRRLARKKRLDTPVISFGGIGAGGAGKTPCVLHVAERLKADGCRPAILTRGYGRARGEPFIVLAPGDTMPVAATGEEAQLFLRAGVAPVGIGVDRYKTGQMVEHRFQPDVMLLDDGFQHWRLARCLDVVLIDALDPFANGALIPLGRLREPLAALERADVFLLTRAVPGTPISAIEARLSRINPRAPIFRSRVVPLQWVNYSTGSTLAPAAVASHPASAFCGLANPRSFWQTLAELGCVPLDRRAFRDHHMYTPDELAQLAAQARSAGSQMLLTTEKDAMNLPAAPVEGMPLLYLRIRMEIEDEPRFMELISGRLVRQRLLG